MSTGYDAWNTPGWTSQHPAYASTPDGSPALPAGVVACTITGTYLSASGKGYYGTVTLSPSIPRMLIGQTEVMLATVRTEVKNGRLSATIYAMPQDVIWNVREAVGPARQSYDIVVPSNTATADLTSLVKVADGS